MNSLVYCAVADCSARGVEAHTHSHTSEDFISAAKRRLEGFKSLVDGLSPQDKSRVLQDDGDEIAGTFSKNI